MTSLATEKFPESLFGSGFEERLKRRSETAKTLLQASSVGRSQHFFRGRTTPFKFRGGRGAGEYGNPPIQPPFQRPFPLQGRKTNKAQGLSQFTAPTDKLLPVASQCTLLPGMNLNLHVLNLDHVPLAGRLKHCMANWKLICADPWVLGAVQGTHLDFVTSPFRESVPLPQPFSREEASMVEMEVQEMLQKSAIHKVPPEQSHKGFVSNLFLVPKRVVGQRPVINVRHLNNS